MHESDRAEQGVGTGREGENAKNHLPEIAGPVIRGAVGSKKSTNFHKAFAELKFLLTFAPR